MLLAFVARPVGTAIFMRIDRKHGRVTKLTLALFLLGTCTVAMGLVPSYEVLGDWAIVAMAVLRIGQGLAIGGSWDGLSSLLALSAPRRRGSRRSGSVMPNVVPTPGVELTSTRPSWASTMVRTIARPRPVPWIA